MRLAVFLNEVEVGAIERDAGSRTAFRFADSYLAMRSRPVLGQYFVDKLRRPPVPETTMPAFFANLLPEGELRRLLASAVGAREHQDFALLARLGEDLSGAVRVKMVDEGAAGDEPVPAPTPSFAGKLRFSLAGVQLKFSMARRDKQLVLPARGQGGDWILKLPDRELYPDGRHARLSPAYDLVATVAYPGYGDKLALPFHGSVAFEAVSLAGFRRLARVLGSERDPEAMVAWVREDVATIMGCREAALGGLSLEGHHALSQLHARLRAAPDSLLR
jgi:HipA-like protein